MSLSNSTQLSETIDTYIHHCSPEPPTDKSVRSEFILDTGNVPSVDNCCGFQDFHKSDSETNEDVFYPQHLVSDIPVMAGSFSPSSVERILDKPADVHWDTELDPSILKISSVCDTHNAGAVSPPNGVPKLNGIEALSGIAVPIKNTKLAEIRSSSADTGNKPEPNYNSFAQLQNYPGNLFDIFGKVTKIPNFTLTDIRRQFESQIQEGSTELRMSEIVNCHSPSVAKKHYDIYTQSTRRALKLNGISNPHEGNDRDRYNEEMEKDDKKFSQVDAKATIVEVKERRRFRVDLSPKAITEEDILLILAAFEPSIIYGMYKETTKIKH